MVNTKDGVTFNILYNNYTYMFAFGLLKFKKWEKKNLRRKQLIESSIKLKKFKFFPYRQKSRIREYYKILLRFYNCQNFKPKLSSLLF